MDGYYIEAGVHRAIAAREAGLTEIEAVLHTPDQPSRRLIVSLDGLHSPRASVIGVKTKRYDLPGLIRAMSDPAARLKVPPIEIQRLGEPGQPALVPLATVVIVDEEVP